MKLLISLFASLLAIAACTTAQTPPEYKIVKTISLAGDAGWDYLAVDDSTGRLFVSHGTAVQVVDAASGTTLATIPNLNGVHGIALAPEFNKGFITNGRDSTVTTFDLTTYATVDRFKITGANPDAILYDAFSKRVFVYNGRSASATVLNARTNKIIATVTLDGKPEFSVSDGHGTVYVNIEDKNEICLLNPMTLAVEQVWPIKPGVEPSGLALDNANHRLFAVCGNKLMTVVDAQTGKLLATLPIGDRADGVAFDPTLRRAYSSNGDGTITVVQEETDGTFKVLTTVATQKGARTIAVDAKTHHLYLPTAEFGDPPTATAENPRPRPSLKPGSFVVLDVAPVK